MNNEQALNAFIVAIGQADELLKEFTEYMTENMMDIGPNEVNWAHVGDARHVVVLLEQIKDFCSDK
jgi:hypothetical protein